MWQIIAHRVLSPVGSRVPSVSPLLKSSTFFGSPGLLTMRKITTTPFAHNKQFVIERNFTARRLFAEDVHENNPDPNTAPMVLGKHTFHFLGRHIFQDIYYDVHFNEISDKEGPKSLIDSGIFIRERDGKMSAKIRCCGDGVAGGYRELSRGRVNKYLASVHGLEKHQLRKVMDITTRRSRWRSGPYTVNMDDVQSTDWRFDHHLCSTAEIIGRVERRKHVEQGREVDVWETVDKEMRVSFKLLKLLWAQGGEVVSRDDFIRSFIED